MKNVKKHLPTIAIVVVCAMALLLVDVDTAYAAKGGGGGLPFEGALSKVQKSITGPVDVGLVEGDQFVVEIRPVAP